eukprot:scaffold3.g6325.t1
MGGDASGSADLEAPLLIEEEEEEEQKGLSNGVTGHEPEPPPPGAPGTCSPPGAARTCSHSGGVSNLVVSAVGAGMLALPRAFAETGIAAGLLLFAFSSVLTFWSAGIVVRHAAGAGTVSYGDLVSRNFGVPGAALLRLSIIVHSIGVMVVYLVVIQDMLVGAAPAYAGLLPELTGRHDGPWWLSRPLVAGALTAAVAAPLLLPRSLTAVARWSRLGVAMVGLLAATVVGLAVAAVAEGRAAAVHVLPPPAAGPASGPLELARHAITVVSVACLAFTIHFVVLPVQASLKDEDTPSMLRVLRHAVGLCTAIYAGVALSGYALFGDATEGDVLKNLTIRFAARVVPAPVAAALIGSIQCAYTFNLLVNFTWALRENASELLLGRSDRQLGDRTYYALTYLFPSLLVLGESGAGAGRRAGAAAMLALGAAMAVVETANQLGLGR